MPATSARALSLLSMLTTGATLNGQELAARLGVSQRTLRRDVDTLRDLGYTVEPVMGAGGGYRLGPGGALPPLVLDEEQVIAIAVALQTTSTVLPGIEEASRRALATIRQVMPHRLRRDADAFTVTAVPNQWEFPAPAPDADLVRAVGAAVRQGVLLRLHYDDPEDPGPSDSVVLEPHHLVVWAARWYLVAHDPTRENWRVLRLDRITDPIPSGVPFTARPLPEGDPGSSSSRPRRAATAWHRGPAPDPLSSPCPPRRSHGSRRVERSYAGSTTTGASWRWARGRGSVSPASTSRSPRP